MEEYPPLTWKFPKINIIPFKGNYSKKLWKLGNLFLFWRQYWQGIKGDKQIKIWMQEYSSLILGTIFSSIQDHQGISSSSLCGSIPFSGCQQGERTKTRKYLWQFPPVQSYSKYIMTFETQEPFLLNIPIFSEDNPVTGVYI